MKKAMVKYPSPFSYIQEGTILKSFYTQEFFMPKRFYIQEVLVVKIVYSCRYKEI